MDTVLSQSPDDQASQNVAAQIRKADTAAFTIDVGDRQLSGDIIEEFDGNPCRFVFSYGELPVSGEIKPGAGKAELQLLIEVGVIPYTVQSLENRRRLLAVVRSFNGQCPEGLEVDQGQSIFVRGTKVLNAPVTAARLVTSAVTVLLELKPILQTLSNYLPDLAEAIPDWGPKSAAPGV